MRIVPLCLLACALALPALAQDTPAPSLLSLQNEVTTLVARVKPSVVTVVCEKAPGSVKDDGDDDGDAPLPTPGTPPAVLSSIGTGWVFRADGLLLTNYHVVRGATSIRVLFNADSEAVERVAARVIGYDPDADLAVLKVNRTGLPVLELADSDAALAGQWAIAVGSPFEQPQSVTLGVLSASGRHIDKNGTPSTLAYLQTDASINPGNSGGPLLDLNGRVVGLNTAILSPSRASAGIGFSIPSNTIRRLLPLLVAGKQVRRGFVGIQYSRLSPEVAREFGLPGGLQVGSLAQKSGAAIGPAKEAGVREGDLIFGVDGQPVSSVEEFRGLVSARNPGDKMVLNIARPDFAGNTNTLKLDIPLTLGDRARVLGEGTGAPFSIESGAPIVGSGLTVREAKELDAAQKTKYHLKGVEMGAVISAITPASRADEADLREGLRIVRARQDGVWTEVPSAKAWRALEAKAAPGAHLLLQLRDSEGVSVFRALVLPTA